MSKIADKLRQVVMSLKKRQDLKPENVRRMERVAAAAKRVAKKP